MNHGPTQEFKIVTSLLSRSPFLRKRHRRTTHFQNLILCPCNAITSPTTYTFCYVFSHAQNVVHVETSNEFSLVHTRQQPISSLLLASSYQVTNYSTNICTLICPVQVFTCENIIGHPTPSFINALFFR